MNESPSRQIPPLVRIMLAFFSLLLIIYIPLKIYIAMTETRGSAAEGAKLSIFVTNELNAYREPCG